MKVRPLALLLLVAVLGATLGLSIPQRVFAQSHSVKEDMAKLAKDIHAGVERSTLTPQEKEQFRDDFRELKQARERHEPFATLRAARSIRATLNSGAFKPEDQQKIKQDLQAIREAREARPGF